MRIKASEKWETEFGGVDRETRVASKGQAPWGKRKRFHKKKKGSSRKSDIVKTKEGNLATL